MRGTPEERFWAKVEKTETCWNWTASINTHGYGMFNLGTKIRGAHRFSYELLVGSIPEGMLIDHKCHNRHCVNPEHLRLVTMKQNLENLSGTYTTNKSGVRGVSFSEASRKWRGNVMHQKRQIHVGLFDTIAEAEAAVTAKRLELFTHNDKDRREAA
jgi:hypothetical protein